MKTGLNFLGLTTLVALTAVSYANAAETVDPEQRIKELGIVLQEPTTPTGSYVKAVRTGNIVYLAGHLPLKADGSLYKGKLGRDLSIEQGQEAARLATIELLSSLKNEVGDLNNVVKIIKVLGMVNSTDAFEDHPKIINTSSNLLVSVFGETVGKHARSAVGMGSLPFGVPVEIEMIVEVNSPEGK